MDPLCRLVGATSYGVAPPLGSCLPDVLCFLLTTAYIWLAPCIALYLRHASRKGKSGQFQGSKFIGHYWRCLVIIILIFLYILEIGEYCVASERSSVPVFILLVPANQLLALLVGIFLHFTIETRKMVKLLLVEISYWILAMTWKILRIVAMLNQNMSWINATFSLSACVCAGLVLVALVDTLGLLIEFKTKKYLFDITKEQEYKQTSYKHNRMNGFSQMTFCWLNPLLLAGYREPLELQDLGALPEEEGASTQFKAFADIYRRELISSKIHKKQTSLWKCFFMLIWPDYCLGGIFKLLGDCVGFVGPLGISVIIEYATAQSAQWEMKDQPVYFPTIEQFVSNGYIMGFVVLAAAIAQGTLSQCSTHLVNIGGIRLKSALQSLIYDKCLKIASWTSSDISSNNLNEKNKLNGPQNVRSDQHSQKSTGEEGSDISPITNLMSEDSFNIMSFVWIGHYVWAIPLKIGILMYLLYLKLGVSAIIGATLCIFTMAPLQFYIGKKMSTNSKMTAERSDIRMMKINEVLQGIKVLKMYGWESIYGNKILEARRQELNLLNRDSFYWAMITFLTHASSVLITLVTFGLYFAIEEEHMSPANVFAGLALFNQLTVPLFIFPVTVPIIISATISVRRLREFLHLPEVSHRNSVVNYSSKDTTHSKNSEIENFIDTANIQEPPYTLDNIEETEENENDDVFKDNLSDKNSSADSSVEGSLITNDYESIVRISEANFTWGVGEKMLSSITVDALRLRKGKLTIIVGKTGSGKSSFLSALIGEMNLTKGSMVWSSDHSMAYVPQTPWLTSSSIRDNILFGRSMRARRYRRVLASCSLHSDLAAHTARDLASANALSGGQRQRVALARALYSKASVLVLDDPLSAIDQTVAQKVFERGIKKAYERDKKTVLMVTHRMHLLQHADQIILVENGKVRTVGTLSEAERIEPSLVQEWRSSSRAPICSDSVIQPQDEKNLRNNCHLFRLANKVSRQAKSVNNDDLDGSISEDTFVPSFVPLRRRLTTFHGSRYFTHDLVLPTDECDDEILRSAVPKRSSTRRRKLQSMNRIGSRKHKTAERSSSLQVTKHKVKPAPMLRQFSSPTIRCPINNNEMEPIGRPRNEDKNQQKCLIGNLFPISSQKLIETQTDSPQVTRQRSVIKRLLSRSSIKSKCSSPTSVDNEQTPVKRILSTNSAASDEYIDDDELSTENSAMEKLVSDEEREYGTIPRRVYFEYFKSCGTIAGSLYLISSLAWQGLRIYTDMWLSEWTGKDSGPTGNVVDVNTHDMTKYFRIYSALSIASIAMSFTSNVVGQYAGALARKKLHTKLLANIILCPVIFFESTPLGRIINRFSTDIGIIDKKIATSIQRLLQFLFLCLSAIVINAALTPWFLFIALPICALYYIIQKVYRSSARELQRLDAITKSPVFSHFGETLRGLSSIRAYGQQSRFTSLLWTKMDINSNAFIILNSSNRWLGIALDYLGGVIVFAAINAALVSARLYPETVSPSLVGLAINYTLLVPIYLNWVVKFLSDVEMYMSAVERVQQYSALPTEDYGNSNVVLPPNWPTQGEVSFSGVTLRYGQANEPVVSKLDLIVPAGQKLAICGRTGSGKSSLLMSILRMVEVSEGTITVDGVDLKNVPLRTLRSRLAAVPQEGMLFGGPLRDNLSPVEYDDDNSNSCTLPSPLESPKNFCFVNSHKKSYSVKDYVVNSTNEKIRSLQRTDAEIWEALELVHLKPTLMSYPGGLDSVVAEGGTGWSVGECQQLMAARALLRSGALLLLDEPTAALDPRTEANLLTAFAKTKRTTITVAHRLSTIMDYDRVIVMDEGRIVEDGSPKELLSRPMSIFSSMLRAAEE